MTNAHWLLLLNLASTWYMVGLIWMVQIVHYKLFDRVGDDVFARYAVDHARLITPIVAIPMLLELASAIGLVALPNPVTSPTTSALGLALVVLIWASTAFLQVPCHNQLATGFDAAAYQRLVETNWIRTVLWSLRGILTGYWFVSAMTHSHPASIT
ncbi:MAG: hypothetical protein AAGD07_04490 [Planctomycetota bacterium]